MKVDLPDPDGPKRGRLQTAAHVFGQVGRAENGHAGHGLSHQLNRHPFGQEERQHQTPPR